ncbi:MAG: alpha-mannosidase, partial [bacterium]|nr:alpha-mannosidase [bacterium]
MQHAVHLIGNAHLDPVWLWRWTEGCQEARATFRSALDRMNEFPDFIFTCAQAALYQWIEEIDPAMFEEIRARVREGRWVIAGGWWMQPDCNIPGGESFARQALYSQRYFQSRFGARARVGYNVDSFGHNLMLPQLLTKAGMDAYVMMRPGPGENDTIPRGAFWWESPDGSRVLTFRIYQGPGFAAYGNFGPLDEKIKAHAGILTDAQPLTMAFYGVGNHGGGPTIENIHEIHRLQAAGEGPQLLFSSPNAFFDAL